MQTCCISEPDRRRTKRIQTHRKVARVVCGGCALIVSHLLKVLSPKLRKGHQLTSYPSMAKLRKARCFWPQGRRRKGSLPPLYKGGKARFPGIFVASLPTQQEGSHVGDEGGADLRGVGSALLLRCGLVCGNGNARGPRAGGGDAKRHDDKGCPAYAGHDGKRFLDFARNYSGAYDGRASR